MWPEHAGSPSAADFYYHAIVASAAMRIGRFCIDWKVVAGLAAAAVGIFILQPRLFVAALPVLLVAACPVSMVLMMWGMRSMSPPTQPVADQPQPVAEPPLSPQEQIAWLHTQLRDLQSAQLAISEQIRNLEAALDRPEQNPAEDDARLHPVVPLVTIYP